MTDAQTKLVSAAQIVVDQVNGLTFPEVIVVLGAVADAITGGESREANIARTKMEEAVLWVMRAADIRKTQEIVAKEAVALAAESEKPPQGT